MTIEIHIHGAATIHVHGADGAEVIHINGKPAETSSLDEFVRSVRPADDAYAHGSVRIEASADVHLDIELRDGGIHVVSQNAPAAAKAAFDLMRGDLGDVIKDDLVSVEVARHLITKHADDLAQIGVCSASIWGGKAADGDLLGGWNRRPSSSGRGEKVGGWNRAPNSRLLDP